MGALAASTALKTQDDRPCDAADRAPSVAAAQQEPPGVLGAGLSAGTWPGCGGGRDHAQGTLSVPGAPELGRCRGGVQIQATEAAHFPAGGFPWWPQPGQAVRPVTCRGSGGLEALPCSTAVLILGPEVPWDPWRPLGAALWVPAALPPPAPRVWAWVCRGSREQTGIPSLRQTALTQLWDCSLSRSPRRGRRLGPGVGRRRRRTQKREDSGGRVFPPPCRAPVPATGLQV